MLHMALGVADPTIGASEAFALCFSEGVDDPTRTMKHAQLKQIATLKEKFGKNNSVAFCVFKVIECCL